jgi:hypothetical protein
MLGKIPSTVNYVLSVFYVICGYEENTSLGMAGWLWHIDPGWSPVHP